MDGKRKVCGTCRWCYPYTDVCTNDRSEKCADFVDKMEDCCPYHEMWPGLDFERHKINESDVEQPEPEKLLKSKASGGKAKDRIQHKKPVGRGKKRSEGAAHPGQGEDRGN